MSVVRHPARFPVLLVLAIAALLSNCVRQPPVPETPAKLTEDTTLTTKGPCADKRGSTFKAGPIVCVDDVSSTLSVNPDPIYAWDRVSDKSNAPVMLQWFTRSGGNDLVITPKSTACATLTPECDHAGHCWTLTVPGTTGDCKYNVSINGGPPLDPTIIITTCCGP